MLLVKGRMTIGDIQTGDVDDFKAFINKRSSTISHTAHAAFQSNMEDAVDSIYDKYFNVQVQGMNIRTYLERTYPKDSDFPKMDSLRDVESNTYIIYE